MVDQLRENSFHGRGTDLEVLCPYHESIPDSNTIKTTPTSLKSNQEVHGKLYKTFHLHSCIVSISSDYFRTFPTPHKGRKLDEISSQTFQTCLNFMYTGQLHNSQSPKSSSTSSISTKENTTHSQASKLTHDTISSVLAASQLLGIHGLSQKCFEYLELHLNHYNHLEIQEIARQFHNQPLQYKTLRYSSPNSARDEIVLERRRLLSCLADHELQYQTAFCIKESCKESLQELNKQWEDILEQDLDRCIEQKNMITSTSSSSIDGPVRQKQLDPIECQSYPSNIHKNKGAVGRLVFYDLSYVGETPYQDKEQSQNYPMKNHGGNNIRLPTSISSNQENNSDSNNQENTATNYGHISNHSKPPPSPTKEQNEMYGIVCSYSCLDEAIESADPGDRIYLMPGKYSDLTPIIISKSIEIIGLGNTNKDVNLSSSDDEPIFRITNGCVRLLNLTFQTFISNVDEIGYDEIYAMARCGRHEHNHPLCKLERNGELFLEKCNFLHHSNSYHNNSDFSRVHGLYIEGGNMAIIQDCVFRGGKGSAIAVLNNSQRTLKIYILRNTFINVGAQTAARTPCPIPAAVEFWTLLQNKNSSNMVIGSIQQNHFTYNTGCCLALRGMKTTNSLLDAPNVRIYFKNLSTSYEESTASIHGSYFKREGFKIKIESNIMEKNGYGLSQFEMSHWKWYRGKKKMKTDFVLKSVCSSQNQLESSAKKRRTGREDVIDDQIIPDRPFLMPDGEAIMETYHFLSQDPSCQALVTESFDDTGSVQSYVTINIDSEE